MKKLKICLIYSPAVYGAIRAEVYILQEYWWGGGGQILGSPGWILGTWVKIADFGLKIAENQWKTPYYNLLWWNNVYFEAILGGKRPTFGLKRPIFSLKCTYLIQN